MRRLLFWIALIVLVIIVYKYIWAVMSTLIVTFLMIIVLLIIFTKPGRGFMSALWKIRSGN